MSCNVSSNDKHRRGGCPCETHRGESPGDELAHGIVYVDLSAGSLHNGSVSDNRLDGARYCQMAHMTFFDTDSANMPVLSRWDEYANGAVSGSHRTVFSTLPPLLPAGRSSSRGPSSTHFFCPYFLDLIYTR